MEYKRGEIWWADLENPRKSGPGYRRPVLIIQDDAFNKSRINTIIVAVITSNTTLAEAPGNFELGINKRIGLKKHSVVNISQIITLDKSYLTSRIGRINHSETHNLSEGLKMILSID